MWYNNKNIIKMLTIILAIIIGVGSTFLFDYDNPIEEAAEEVIKKETGIDIDLTPSSPETKNK